MSASQGLPTSSIHVFRGSEGSLESQVENSQNEMALPSAEYVESELNESRKLPNQSLENTSINLSRLSLTIGVTAGIALVIVFLATSNPVGAGILLGALTVLAILGIAMTLQAGKDIQKDFLEPVALGIVAPFIALGAVVISLLGGGELLKAALDIGLTIHGASKEKPIIAEAEPENVMPLEEVEELLLRLNSAIASQNENVNPLNLEQMKILTLLLSKSKR